MNRACLTIIAILAILIASSVTVCEAKKISGGVTVSVRTNKRGKKVNLASAPGYRDACVALAAGKYADALRTFESLDKNGFCCDMIHYYIAQCYQGQNQIVLAQMHYQWVSSYSKDPTLIAYSNSAWQQLGYYSNHRTYAGNGNNFSRAAYGGGGGGGGRSSFG